MPQRSDAAGPGRADFLEQIQLPLRGLARENADEIIGRTLRDLPGIVTPTMRVVEQLVRVTYDPAVTSADAIRKRCTRPASCIPSATRRRTARGAIAERSGGNGQVEPTTSTEPIPEEH